MVSNPVTRAASAVAARITGRAARATAYIRQRKEDVSLKSLESTRVFVSAVFRDLSPTRTSVSWIEPFLLTPIVPTNIPKMKVNEVGLRIADNEEGTNTSDGYMVYPGRLVDVVYGNRVVHVEGLLGIGSEWGSFDLIDELNELLFPEHLIPETGPNWLDSRDPRHRDLFANVRAHVEEVARGSSPTSPERAAAQGVLDALVLGKGWYASIFEELSQQATNAGKPVPFGPTETMWLAHLSMAFPDYAVRYDATAEPEASPMEKAVERLATIMAGNQAAVPQAPEGVSLAVLQRMEEIAAENAELRAMLMQQQGSALAPAAPAPASTEETLAPEPAPAPAVNRKR